MVSIAPSAASKPVLLSVTTSCSLILIFGWPEDCDKDNPPKEVPDLINTGKFKLVEAHDVESFKKGVRIGDALLLLELH
jgi:hypothetical protein